VTLQAAINAMGGQAAVNLINDSVVTGAANPLDGSGQVGTFAWKTLGYEYRYEFQAADQNIFVSGHGQPASAQNGAVIAQPMHIALAKPALHLPFIVISRMLANSEYSALAMGPVPLPNGGVALQVRTFSNADPLFTVATTEDWYFDPVTGLPVTVAFCMPNRNDANDCVAGSMDFSDYREFSGILVPFALVIAQEGSPTSVASVTSIVFNVGLSSSEFDLQAGGQ
jgi:hypothetical protein